jgi:ADP-heptose:LPS heptosyltransferase
MNLTGKRIIISRTDSIGDVMLTLPLCAWLKANYPTVTIIFLGKGYTRPIVEAYSLVDHYEDWNTYTDLRQPQQVQKLKALNADAIIHVFPSKTIAKIAKKAKINARVGTSHRLHHNWTCNSRVGFTRKNSTLHESQLNHELLRPFGLIQTPSLEQVIETTQFFNLPKADLPEVFNSKSDITILHPKSQGSAKEWPIEKYYRVALSLADQGKTVVFTGTKNEGDLFRENLPKHDNIIDSTGMLTLEQLIVLIGKAKNLIACSTGPLHISGYLGTNTIGLFSPKRPIHPGRWKALGKHVSILVNDDNCLACAKKQDCFCIEDISVEHVEEKIV